MNTVQKNVKGIFDDQRFKYVGNQLVMTKNGVIKGKRKVKSYHRLRE